MSHLQQASVRNRFLYRYWNPAATDYFYTINAGEIGTTTPGHVGNHGYTSEGIVVQHDQPGVMEHIERSSFLYNIIDVRIVASTSPT